MEDESKNYCRRKVLSKVELRVSSITASLVLHAVSKCNIRNHPLNNRDQFQLKDQDQANGNEATILLLLLVHQVSQELRTITETLTVVLWQVAMMESHKLS